MAYTSTLPAGNTMASQALAADGRALNALKVQAGQNSPEAAREAAKQFESLFMREMIKSMREATMKSGLLDGAEGNLANDLYDQQLSVQMSGLPGGLTEAIQRQLTRQMGGAEAELSVPSTLSLDTSALRRTASTKNSTTPSPKGLDAFVQHHRATAERVAQDSGIPASFMLGQAGHETGWGRGEIRHKDGSAAYNLFGIKAGKSWTGKVAEVTTTEYINGVARKVTAKFRAYDSYEDSFRDYARLINDNPRYEKARGKVGSAVAYATELQKAGYATDPEYASKLSRAIQSTLRVGRAQA
ncbi:MAG: flagellar rod assembly protein/muramidase FlgJ [Comamonadaceae bacterium SCN 68-20]|nr:flagellar assembly peptidoglycan hydrolase FlgJ [Comamonadaceae bacterium]ODU61757.1 MAG: flagellar rod assembly protein/muramidase FlgJ [Comamonadaceae bacterium SCN 68-20]OJX06465.1 MAG: flagellar rod assembly protein/muramidase FlgJ [Burkholderiales bacterium 68-20]